MDNIILYSTGCPKCNILKKKLNENKIGYEEITDVNQMIKLGINAVPVLQIGDKYLDFPQSIKWINNKSPKGDF